VVCTVRVDRHLPTIGPSLKAGKDVVVEWPLGKSVAEARELLRLKKAGGVKHAIVGLQGRQAPIVKKLKELVNGGRIGRVLHSTYSSQSMLSANSVTQGHEMLGQKEIGANLLTILFGHQIDYVQQGISDTLYVKFLEKPDSSQGADTTLSLGLWLLFPPFRTSKSPPTREVGRQRKEGAF
jgi:predicted dehydrogenase